MLRRFFRPLIVVPIAVLAAATVGVILAQTFDDTQTSSGTVNVTTESADLYICEPTGSTGDPDCPGDDSLADETIFEGIEDLFPGATASWDVRLRNVGTMPWDVTAVVVTTPEVQDPGADCNDTPSTLVTILGKSGDQLNDNHFVDQNYTYTDHNQQALPSIRTESGVTHGAAGHNYPAYHWVPVHVAVGDYEDIRIRVTLPGGISGTCQDNIWNINIDWTVSPHQ